MTSPAQQAAYEQPVVPLVYFIEPQFASGTVYACSFNQTISWDGHDWVGLGMFGKISPVDESAGVASSAMTFELNITDQSTLALAIGGVEEYRGRPAKLYCCPMTESFTIIDTPEICWRGIMDTVAVGINGEEGQIGLKCETSAFGIKRRAIHRINAAQQKQRYPTDTGLDFLTGLIANPQTWLSKKFQQI